MLCFCCRCLPHRVGLTAVTAAASHSPAAHYSAYQGLECDGGGIKLRTPDAFFSSSSSLLLLPRSSSSSFQHLVVDPQALLGQMAYMWALKQLLGYAGLLFLFGRVWQETS